MQYGDEVDRDRLLATLWTEVPTFSRSQRCEDARAERAVTAQNSAKLVVEAAGAINLIRGARMLVNHRRK
jgi:hypothetical protein